MTQASYFISDLHLAADTPQLTALLREHLHTWQSDAAAVYILGDLFEYWAGDDHISDPFNADIAALLKAASAHYPLYFLHGNRDFLLGEAFAAAAGLTLLGDPTTLDLYGQTVLLSHGDALCTDDVAYQQFRAMVRQPAWQQQFLALPLPARLQQIAAVRQQSAMEKDQKSATIMDVNADAVDALLRAHGYPVLIHGHTHRPAVHEFTVDGHACERWVLPDWYGDEGGYLRVDAEGWSMEKFGSDDGDGDHDHAFDDHEHEH